MGANVDAFHAWEQSGPFVHVLIIDRGDTSAANRLTLTDRPYLDKRAKSAGVRYHSTYPAPIHCIISEIKTRETLAGTSFDPIEITNEEGRFDTFLDGGNSYNIRRYSFLLLRGSPDWSLAETDYPGRFQEVNRGTIGEVRVNKVKGTITIPLIPAKMNLDAVIGDAATPNSVGHCYNVPATLVDSGTQEYRFASQRVYITSDANFVVRDAGVELAGPSDMSPDYSRDDEGGYFQGKITLTGGSPAGQLTADINTGNVINNFEQLEWINLCKYVSYSYLWSTGVDNDTQDITATAAICYDQVINASGSKWYAVALSTIKQFSVSNQDLPASTYDTITYSPGTNTISADLVNGGATLFTLYSNGNVATHTLSTPDNIGTASDNGDDTAISTTGSPVKIRVNEAGTILLAYDDDGEITYFTMSTPYDPTTLVKDATKTKDISWVIGGTGSNGMIFDVANEGKVMIAGDQNGFYGFDLVDAWDPSSARYNHGGGFPQTDSLEESGFLTAIFSSDGNYIFGVDTDEVQYRWTINALSAGGGVDYTPLRSFGAFNLRTALFRTNVPKADHDYETGVFWKSETTGGEILQRFVQSQAATFTINRHGSIIATKLYDPADALESWESLTSIYFKDFIMDGKSHIAHVETHEIPDEVYVRWNKNNTVQSPSELGGAVSDDDVEAFGLPYSTSNNSINGNGDDLVYDTFLMNSTDASALQTDIAGLRDTVRLVFDININLSAISLLDDVEIGHKVKAADDWGHPAIDVDDQLMILEREINWTRNMQRLRLLK